MVTARQNDGSMVRTRLESYLAIPRDVLFWLPERKRGKSRRSLFSASEFLSPGSLHFQCAALAQLLVSVCILPNPSWHVVLAPSPSVAKI